MASGPRNHSNVLITGASSGIGARLSRVFAREGHDLVLVARTRERLDALARELREAHGTTARVIAMDLSVPGAPGAVRDRLAADSVEIDVLVNDAGFGMSGPFVELDAARQVALIQVNIVALTELTRLFAPDMVRRGAGRILNVASIAAFQPGPWMAVYCATKAYVLSFSEALSVELRDTGVTVTCVAPGATESGFSATAGVSASRLFRMGTMSSSAVAEAAYAATMRGRTLVVPGWRNRILASTARLVSGATAARVSRFLVEDAHRAG
jgi:short-subunit dehydrogenase